MSKYEELAPDPVPAHFLSDDIPTEAPDHDDYPADSAKEDLVDSAIEEGSAFDPKFFQPVLIIQLNRIYDTLMALLATQEPQGPALAAQLHLLHEAGRFLAPAPAFADTDVTEE